MDPLVDETGQPYAYTGEDPVNGNDPTGLTAELSASGQVLFAGLLESFNSPISGEAPTLGNDLTSLASEYGSLQQCKHVNVGDPISVTRIRAVWD